MQSLKLLGTIGDFNFRIAVVISVFSISCCMGCATIKDSTKGIMGVSTRELEGNRKDAVKKVVAYGYKDCYAKTREILKDAHTYMYAEDRKNNLIAVYVSETDTTPVGVYLKEIDTQSTQVEVSSPSTFAKEFISKKLFTELEKPALK
jgi:hypothetical protein